MALAAVWSFISSGGVAVFVAVGRRPSCGPPASGGRGWARRRRRLDPGVSESRRVGQPYRGLGAVANDDGVSCRCVVLLLPGYDMVSDPLAARFVEFPGPHQVGKVPKLLAVDVPERGGWQVV